MLYALWYCSGTDQAVWGYRRHWDAFYSFYTNTVDEKWGQVCLKAPTPCPFHPTHTVFTMKTARAYPFSLGV